MAKVLYCRDVLPGCPERITGATEHEVMVREAEHAMRSHGLGELLPELQRRIGSEIKDWRPEREGFEDALVSAGRTTTAPESLPLTSSPLLGALKRAGTGHVYVDTADRGELRAAAAPDGEAFAEIDGNTVNQPLVRRVLDRYVDARLAGAATQLREVRPGLSSPALAPYLYTVVSGWIGNEIVGAFGSGRSWDVSLQLHMAAARQPELALALARALHHMVPTAFVKVPLTPDAPHCFLLARDLERHRIPVNFTSTFSARQAVAAALLASVTRTNIFMGRLNEGLRATLLGEHVVLEAQRALARLGRDGARTRLIVASMRDWRTFVRVAGADVFTAPSRVLADFLTQKEVSAEALQNQVAVSYEDRLGVPDEMIHALGAGQVSRLWQVERELVEFLREYGASDEYRELQDGDELVRRFDDAGFGDFFYVPTAADWKSLRQSKLPDLASPLTRQLPLDTLYTLLADADFDREQEAIDARLAAAAG